MAKINRNNDVIEFDRIVAYGCSMTSAHETLDHELFCHLGNANEIDRLKKEYKLKFIEQAPARCKGYIPSKWTDDTGSVNWDKFYEDQKKMSYANKLADMFEVPCLNQSMRGSSVDYAVFQIENDLANGVINPTDLILVGLTQPGRHFYINDEDEFSHMLINKVKTVFQEEYWSTFSSTSNIIWNYYRALAHMEMLNNKHKNILCLTVLKPSPEGQLEDSDFFADDQFYMPDRNTPNGNRLFNVVKQARDFKTIVKLSMSSIEDYSRNKVHGFLHPTILQHEEYAKCVYNEIKIN